jgi:hypothetical protein
LLLVSVLLQSAALRGSGIRFIFIENICNDPDILQQNYLNKMMYSPDYKGIPTRKVLQQRLRACFTAYFALIEAAEMCIASDAAGMGGGGCKHTGPVS